MIGFSSKKRSIERKIKRKKQMLVDSVNDSVIYQEVLTEINEDIHRYGEELKVLEMELMNLLNKKK